MKKRLVIANWKMYVETPEQAKEFIKSLKLKSRYFSGVDVMVAPPYVLVSMIASALKKSVFKAGAQAVSAFSGTKQTGEVSASMLKAAGASFVIVGHSERRAIGESDEMIRAQIEHATAAGLTVVLCVGEKTRDSSGEHFTFVKRQLASALITLPKTMTKLIVAYEPVWAIGKSAHDAMKPAELHEMAIFIRKTLLELGEKTPAMRVPILYGGSVEGENAASLLTEGTVNGFLVGHASASMETFLPILQACK